MCRCATRSRNTSAIVARSRGAKLAADSALRCPWTTSNSCAVLVSGSALAQCLALSASVNASGGNVPGRAAAARGGGAIAGEVESFIGGSSLRCGGLAGHGRGGGEAGGQEIGHAR